jgi:hypothetical protein
MINVKEATLFSQGLVWRFSADSTQAILRFEVVKIIIRGHSAMPEFDTALKVAHDAAVALWIAVIDSEVFF